MRSVCRGLGIPRSTHIYAQENLRTGKLSLAQKNKPYFLGGMRMLEIYFL